MDDIIEIFEEFEKKYLKLIKDIILRPKLVVDSLSNQKNEYVKPFRFFSYISSIFLLIIIVLNRFDIAGFWSESFFLPEYWDEYYQSANELNLTLFPITGFFFIVLISSILSFAFFRKHIKSYKTHLNLTFYMSGVLLIYLLIVTVTIILIDSYIEEYSDLADILLQSLIMVLLIVIPFFFVAKVQWELDGNKIIRPIKSLIIVISTGFLFSSFYYDLELDRIANDMIFYREVAKSPQEAPTYNSKTKLIYTNSTDLYLYPPNTFTTTDNYLISLYKYGQSELGIYEVKNSVKKTNTLNLEYLNTVSLYNFEDRFYVIVHEHVGESVMNYLYRGDGDKLNLLDTDSLMFNTRSSMIKLKDNILLSGINESQAATLFSISNTSLTPSFELNKENTNFDYVLPSSDSTLVTITSTTKDRNLNKIEVQKIDIKSKNMINSKQLFENRVSQVPAYHEWNTSDLKVYNPWVAFSTDSTYIYVAYQLMNDKTFELQLYKLNQNLEVIAQNYFNLDANISFFYSYAIDQNKLYVYGKSFLLVRENPFNSQESNPFIASFEVNNLEHQKTIFLESYAEMSGRKLAGGIRSHLYLDRVKMSLSKDSIKILSLTNHKIMQRSTPKF